MTEMKTTNAREAAREIGVVDFRHFAARCMLRGLSYQTARDIWYGAKKKRGWTPHTQATVAKILRRPVSEIFDD
jgi:hypothetical protein